jgi:beta-phosphoglucomutase
VIDSILLDMDGVLLDSSETHTQSYRETFESFGLDYQFEYHDFAGRSTIDVMTEVSENLRLDPDLAVSMTEFKQQKVREKLLEMENVPLFPFVALDLVKLSNDFKLALCTSASKETVQTFLKSGIDGEIFTSIVTSKDVKHSKPNPEIYSKAMREMESRPENCLIVEDSESGIIAGIRSGAKVCCINTRTKYELISKKLGIKIMYQPTFHDFVNSMLSK